MYTTRWDLAQAIRERAGLGEQFTAERVYDVTPTPRGRYEDIDEAEFDGLCREVWGALDCGPYPF